MNPDNIQNPQPSKQSILPTVALYLLSALVVIGTILLIVLGGKYVEIKKNLSVAQQTISDQDKELTKVKEKELESHKEEAEGISSSANKEVENLKGEVGALIPLPNEDPSIATVVDTQKLQGQPFFAQAQNGDKVLFYQNSNKKILYRPSENRIINQE